MSDGAGRNGRHGLSATNIRFTWPGTSDPLLDGIDLHVAPGRCLAIVGPSGCGKSTLLRIIAGLETADRGDLAWNDEPLAEQPTHARRIGLMFQEAALFPHLDVRGNVAFGLRYRPDLARDRASHDAEVARWLRLVGLEGLEDRPVEALSGGQRQRVALARSLAAGPRAILLDEPLSALDRDLRERLARDLKHTIVEAGVAAIWVTHDEDEAALVGDEVLRLAGNQMPAGTNAAPPHD